MKRTKDVMLSAQAMHCSTQVHGVNCVQFLPCNPVTSPLLPTDDVTNAGQRLPDHVNQYLMRQFDGKGTCESANTAILRDTHTSVP